MKPDQIINVVGTVYPLAILIIAVELRELRALPAVKLLTRRVWGARYVLIGRIFAFLGVAAGVLGLTIVFSFALSSAEQFTPAALDTIRWTAALLTLGVIFPLSSAMADATLSAMADVFTAQDRRAKREKKVRKTSGKA